MTYARKTLSEIKLIHGDYGNFIKGQKLPKDKEKKYKTPPYKDLAASNEIDGEPLDEKCWPGYEKKGMKTMFGKRYPNCVKKKKTKKEEFSDWRSEFEQIDEKAVSQQQQKFFGMVRATQKGEMDNPSDEVKKAAASMTKSDVKKYASTKHDKLPKKIEEKLDSEDKPFVKKLVGKLRKGSKTHAKQADDLEKAMKENVNLKFHLGGNKKEISLNYGNTPIAYKRTEKYKSKTSPNAAINKALVKFKKKDDFVKKDIGEDITDEALTIQDWNVDDIKFTEIETVDIIKAKPLLDEKFQFLKKAFGKTVILGTGASKAMGKSPRLSRKASISLTTGKALKGFKDAIQKVKDMKKIDAPPKFPRDTSRTITKTTDNIITIDPSKMGKKPRVIKKKNPPASLKDHYDWRTEIDEDWQKVNRKDKTDGLSRKAVKAYRRENPGSKLQTAVTKDPKKLKKGSKSAKRRLSFCRRMKGMKKKLTSAKTRRDPDSRINKALRRWNC